MINGYSNPYEILSSESNSQFISELRSEINNFIVIDGKKESQDFQLKMLEQIMGTGMISKIYQWTGQYLKKHYYKECQDFIEEEYNYIISHPSTIKNELKYSFLIFAVVGKWLDIVDTQSTEFRDSAKMVLLTIKNLSLTKAIEESVEEDLASGKYTRWFEFTMSSFFCLLLHCWKSMPDLRGTIVTFARLANECADHTIDALFKYRFNQQFLDSTVLEICRNKKSEILLFGKAIGDCSVRKTLVDEISKNFRRIISDFNGND